MPKRAPSRPLPGMAALQPARKVAPKRHNRSVAEDKLSAQVRSLALPAPVREHKFHPTRNWRFDFAWPDRMVAVEVEGGGWVQGRHGRGLGLEGDCVKYSEAALAGWLVVRVTPAMVHDGRALKLVWRALGGAAAYTPPPST